MGYGCHRVAMGLWGTVVDFGRAWRTMGSHLGPWGSLGSMFGSMVDHEALENNGGVCGSMEVGKGLVGGS